MIDLSKNEAKIQQNAKHCRERKIKLPTFGQMQNPETIPKEIKDELKNVGLWETHPANLFRISWKNEPVSEGGGFGGVNYVVIPPELSGVKAKIIALVGKWFPTGAHKVGFFASEETCYDEPVVLKIEKDKTKGLFVLSLIHI